MTRSSHGEAIHGARTREWRTWQNMRARCQTPTHQLFHRYGARGICVSERWNDYKTFLDDVGRSPGPGYSLDRINNHGNYEPGNVRWATAEEQQQNRTITRWLTHDGITLCLAEWARRKGISHQCLLQRLKRGWSVEEALTATLDKRKSHHNAGRKRHAATACRILPLSREP